MKKYLLACLWIVIVGLMVSCQNNTESLKTSWEEDNLHGKVKTCKVIVYQALVKFGEIQKREMDNYTRVDHPLQYEMPLVTVTKYNEDGMCEYIEGYDYDMDIKTKTVYNFDGTKLIDWREYGEDGELNYEDKIVYDEESGKIKETFYTIRLRYYQASYHFLYSYDGDGITNIVSIFNDTASDRTQVKDIKKHGKIESQIRYDSIGNVISIMNFNNKEKLIFEKNFEYNDSTSYAYNKNMDLILKTEPGYDEDYDYDYLQIVDTLVTTPIESVRKKTVQEYRFEYEYDKHNNWIKRITYKGDKPLYIEEREIEYY